MQRPYGCHTYLPVLVQDSTRRNRRCLSLTLHRQEPLLGCPPRRIPAHYRQEIEKKINTMLEQGIIEESSSPWMAPAVFVPKKSGEIRMCIDYRELNKRTKKDAYPLPLLDEVQDRLAGSTIFSTLDLQSGYWQLPVNKSDRE